jgi:hypothetical protein
MRIAFSVALCFGLALGNGFGQRRAGGGGVRSGGGFSRSAGGGSFHGGFTGGGYRGGGFSTAYRSGFGGGWGRSYRSSGYLGGYWPASYWGSWPWYGFGDTWDAYPDYATYPVYAYRYPVYQPSTNITVVHRQQASTSVYQPEAAPARAYDEYGQPMAVRQAAGDSSPTPYLIAFRDRSVQAAVAYWVSGSTLHYITLDHVEKQVEMSGVDRELSVKLNGDRQVRFTLPQGR